MDGSALMGAYGRLVNAVKDLLRRMAVVEAKVQRALNQGAGAGSSAAAQQWFSLAVVGASVILPGSMSAPVSATVTLAALSGSAIVAGSQTVLAYSYHDKTIAAASLIAIAWDGLNWYVVDVQSCTELS